MWSPSVPEVEVDECAGVGMSRIILTTDIKLKAREGCDTNMDRCYGLGDYSEKLIITEKQECNGPHADIGVVGNAVFDQPEFYTGSFHRTFHLVRQSARLAGGFYLAAVVPVVA